MLLLIIAGLTGLIVGSFLNVLIVRTPLMAGAEREGLDHTQFNLAWPRSHCPQCQHPLALRDLLPILSYLWLRGRCRYCQHALGRLYPLVEGMSALYAVLLVSYFGWGFLSLALFVFGAGLLCMSLTDARTQLVPDVLSLPFLWLGLLFNTTELFTPLTEALYGAVFGYLILWGIFWLYWCWRKKEGLGYGDFKLMAALGAWLGVVAVPWVLLLAALLGCGYGLWQGVKKQQALDQALAQAIPFAPFLCAAAGLVMAWRVAGAGVLQ